MAAFVRSRVHWGFVGACVVLGVVSTAWGDPIWVQVTGEVTYSDFSDIGVDSPVTGLYTYDDEAGTLPGSDNPVWYEAVAIGLTFVGGSSIQTNTVAIMVNNNSGGNVTGVDEYAVDFSLVPGGGTWTGAFEGPDWDILQGSIIRYDPTGTAWDDVALADPETVLALLPYDDSWVHFYDFAGEDPVGSMYIRFKVTDLSVVAAPVPVPGAVVLGAIGLGCCRRLLRRTSM
ncbi:MAG: hypothetical protein ABFE13_01185 [Phycisphaerales bacterium]